MQIGLGVFGCKNSRSPRRKKMLQAARCAACLREDRL